VSQLTDFKDKDDAYLMKVVLKAGLETPVLALDRFSVCSVTGSTDTYISAML
jgi:hypothetical protein